MLGTGSCGDINCYVDAQLNALGYGSSATRGAGGIAAKRGQLRGRSQGSI